MEPGADAASATPGDTRRPLAALLAGSFVLAFLSVTASYLVA